MIVIVVYCLAYTPICFHFFFFFFLVTESNLRVFFYMCFCGAAYDFSIGLGVLCVGQGLFSALGGKER